MDDTHSSAPAETSPAPALEISQQEMEAGKVFAILCYALGFLGVPFFILPLVMRDNEFSLFHAKQVLMLYLFGVAGYIIGFILTFICIGVFVLLGVGVLMLVFAIMGLINAINGRAKPLPLIGGLAEKWFAGVKKVVK